ncbi:MULTISPECIES: patatin-like phospholipase family protein [unclassified Novosphingobium]|uniref:patatin-like phospholipase family protein n=1 Tax=unclassified Novosphingobium TaxID=2644732 RepID=UPI00146C6B20|nr:MULTISPECIES: patatin-like phospholipase family protein [unclassified Novosphingobium]NMN04861.1 hypothetical protein [Novosphingobium sp. SG919]NMN85145.1 hypothetical protein [Novosphingobium sp. SG916]
MAAVLVLSGCAHQRPGQISPIAIRATRIVATAHGNAPKATPDDLTTFAREAYAASRKDMRALGGGAGNCVQLGVVMPMTSNSEGAQYLVLSGGSLNGAFGAGMFLGLQDKNLLPPLADVVTGVSTGSLQSTFLFLRRTDLDRAGAGPDANDRDYKWVGGMAAETLPGADNATAPKPGHSDIEDLALAYSIRKETDILRPYPFGGIGMLAHGAKGSLDPLRKRLLALISPGTIRAVAQQACRGRKLYVGVTDVDDGYGYALDLTALALSAFDGNATATRMLQVRQAYVESLIASSSVPVGAKPVQLRIRLVGSDPEEHRRNLFVDGGARFGVFLHEIKDAQAMAQRSGRANVTLLTNTRLSISPWHDGDLKNPQDGWLLTTLGLRTVDILENQVYQLSVGMVEAQADSLRMAYISNENLMDNGRPAELPGDHLYQGKSCDAWHKQDDEEHHPVQFFASYMSCLLDYGRARGQRNQWNTVPQN